MVLKELVVLSKVYHVCMTKEKNVI